MLRQHSLSPTGTRTRTPLRAAPFEGAAYANSAIAAVKISLHPTYASIVSVTSGVGGQI